MRSIPSSTRDRSMVLWWRAGGGLALLIVWQTLAVAPWLPSDVVPTFPVVGRAVISLAGDPEFWSGFATTSYELAWAVVFGAGAGVIAGLVLGRSRLLSKAYEPLLYYLAPTPKIIFFPVAILWFGVGSESKIAMGALSCFFPIALSVAAGLRGIRPVLVQVGRSLGASRMQMIASIYLPAAQPALLNGLRLGFGMALIGVLLAETKLSNRGIGFLILQSYTHFDIARMYALLLVMFAVAVSINVLLSKLVGEASSMQRSMS